MAYQFQKHYSLAEARALLPQVRAWLLRLNQLRVFLEDLDKQLTRALTSGQDQGGNPVDRWISLLADLKEVAQEFQEREIQIKDLERGLVDFPAILAGKEVFLCWEQGEEDIQYWHDLDAGFAGRTPL